MCESQEINEAPKLPHPDGVLRQKFYTTNIASVLKNLGWAVCFGTRKSQVQILPPRPPPITRSVELNTIGTNSGWAVGWGMRRHWAAPVVNPDELEPGIDVAAPFLPGRHKGKSGPVDAQIRGIRESNPKRNILAGAVLSQMVHSIWVPARPSLVGGGPSLRHGQQMATRETLSCVTTWGNASK